MGLCKLHKPQSNYRGFRVREVPDYVGSTDTGLTYFNYELVNKVCIYTRNVKMDQM